MSYDGIAQRGLLLMLGLLLQACASGESQVGTRPVTQRSVAGAGTGGEQVDQGVRHHLALLSQADGSPMGQRQREDAELWLLSHPKQSYLEVLRAVENNPADMALIQLLGRYRRSQSTGVLLRAFALGGWIQRYAADALGRSPDPQAAAVLLDSLLSEHTEQVVAALAGLEVRADRAVCPEILPTLDAEQADIRWMGLHVAAALHCVPIAQLRERAGQDSEASVRQLVNQL